MCRTGWTLAPSSTLRAAWSLLVSKYADGANIILGVAVAGGQVAMTDFWAYDRTTHGYCSCADQYRLVADGRRAAAAVGSGTISGDDCKQADRRAALSAQSSEAERACQFQTLLVLQAAEEDRPQQQYTSSHWFIRKRDEDGSHDTCVIG